MSYVAILGATGDIGIELANTYASHGHAVMVIGRNTAAAKTLSKQLMAQYPIKSMHLTLDVNDTGAIKVFKRDIQQLDIKGVVSVVGYLGDQQKAESSDQETQLIINTNFSSLTFVIQVFSQYFKTKKSGFFAIITSVAGDRGKKSNYTYGAAKAGLSTYLSGLRNQLSGLNIPLTEIKLGYVKTKMSQDKQISKYLSAEPKEIAQLIYKNQQKNKNIVYLPLKWYWIMKVIKSIPEFVFKKINL